MVRPLRITIEDGWYHVINRGIERRAIFKTEADCGHFLELAAQLPSRFGVVVHSYALIPNHYQLLVQTPQANLSQAMQWLNVSYGVWFNRKYRRVGPLFQGRYKAVLVASDGHHREVSRYIHLSPLRTQKLGPKKQDRKSDSASKPAALEQERLEFLHSYHWSSYPGYLRAKTRLTWLTTEALLGDFEGATEGQRIRAYQRFVEEPIRTETLDAVLDQAWEGTVYGTREFRARMLKLARGEKAQRRAAQKRVNRLDWDSLRQLVAELKGEPWEDFVDRRGDDGRDLALYVARRFGGYSLPELGKKVGVSYAAVAQAVARTQDHLKRPSATRQLYSKLSVRLNFKTRP
jgi:REP element-mobilizing transposase RayT